MVFGEATARGRPGAGPLTFQQDLCGVLVRNGRGRYGTVDVSGSIPIPRQAGERPPGAGLNRLDGLRCWVIDFR